MQVRETASLVIVSSSLVTAALATSFSKMSARTTSQVALGMFTVLAASFTVASAMQFYDMAQEEDEGSTIFSPLEEEMSVRVYVGKTWNRFGPACALIIFGLSVVVLLDASWRAVRGRGEPEPQAAAKRFWGLF